MVFSEEKWQSLWRMEDTVGGEDQVTMVLDRIYKSKGKKKKKRKKKKETRNEKKGGGEGKREKILYFIQLRRSRLVYAKLSSSPFPHDNIAIMRWR